MRRKLWAVLPAGVWTVAAGAWRMKAGSVGRDVAGPCSVVGAAEGKEGGENTGRSGCCGS